MLLNNRPTNPGAAQDAYEVLEGVFGGEEFSKEEAVTAICQALQMPAGQAQTIVASLVSSGCASGN